MGGVLATLQRLAGEPDAPTGAALVAAVQREVPDDVNRIDLYEVTLVSPEEATVRVAFDGVAETGGGLDYERVEVRLCVEYVVVTSASGRGVSMSDTECSQELIEGSGPTRKPDRVITLD